MRDGGTIPAPSSGRSAQVCIVGGGLSGLAAAYRLRDTDVVLLEHLESTGGHCARGRWRDVYYSECAAYFVEPEDPLDKFYEEMKFPIKKIEEPSDSALIADKYVLDTFGTGANKLPFPDAARKDFVRMRREMEKLLESDDYPNMPIADATAEARKLDRMTWADWLLKDRGFHPAVKIFVDLYCRSALGAPSSEHLSAFAGLNFWASEFMPRYTFPGGNALAAEMLHAAVEKAGRGRIVNPATAVFVEPRGSDVAVTYLDREGKAHLVEAKTVIMACPKFVARHLVKGIPKDQDAAMRELTYGSYVVANVLCSEPIVEASYDTWTDEAPFTDFIVADWVTRSGVARRAPTRHQVISVYWPTAYDHESPLKDGSYAAYRDGAIEGLAKLLPGREEQDRRRAPRPLGPRALPRQAGLVHREVGDRQARRRARALRALRQPGAAGVRVGAGRGARGGQTGAGTAARLNGNKLPASSHARDFSSRQGSDEGARRRARARRTSSPRSNEAGAEKTA